MLTPPLVHSQGGFAVFATTGVAHIGCCVVVVLTSCTLNEPSAQFGAQPPERALGLRVKVPRVVVSVALPNATVGLPPPPPPIRPVTMTYSTAAKTTVMATIRMVAITGDTAFSSFRTGQLRFMFCPLGGFPHRPTHPPCPWIKLSSRTSSH